MQTTGEYVKTVEKQRDKLLADLQQADYDNEKLSDKIARLQDLVIRLADRVT